MKIKMLILLFFIVVVLISMIIIKINLFDNFKVSTVLTILSTGFTKFIFQYFKVTYFLSIFILKFHFPLFFF